LRIFLSCEFFFLVNLSPHTSHAEGSAPTRAPDTVAVIPAGGSGVRFGGEIPKQYLPLRGLPIIARTLRALEECAAISAIVVAVAPERRKIIRQYAGDYAITKLTDVVEGGKERQHSIMNALGSEVCRNAEFIAVHDAVRPFAAARLIEDVLAAARLHGAAAPGLVPKDTIKQCDTGGFAQTTPPRERLRAVQTPQIFRRDILLAAYNRANAENILGTDDASLVEYAGFPVKIVEGDEKNFKITTPLDFQWAEFLLERSDFFA
jgi:2-C-methyl-D-erythritol 4-phosphate cytidylyltransferase